MAQPPVQYVSKEELRRLFNEGRYFERVESGELLISEVVLGCPSPANFPIGARSQMVEYQTRQGRTVAWVHQDGDEYGNPAEGSKPDPKFLFHNGVRYKLSDFPPSPPLGRSRSRRRR
jgi:hypothetical protein